MSDSQLRDMVSKSKVWATLSWFIFAVIVLCAVVVFSQFGMQDNFYGIREVNPTVAVACISQILVSLLIAGHFTLMHNLHQMQASALKRSPISESTDVDTAPSGPVSVAGSSEDYDGGRTVSYINETSPLFGLVAAGDRLVSINGEVVTTTRQAAMLMSDGDNTAVFASRSGHVYSEKFKSHVGKSLGIKFH